MFMLYFNILFIAKDITVTIFNKINRFNYKIYTIRALILCFFLLQYPTNYEK